MAKGNAQSETAATQTHPAPPVSKERRRQILKVLFISLLLDLVRPHLLMKPCALRTALSD